MYKKLLFFAAFITMSTFAFAQPKLEIVGGSTYNWGDVKLNESPLKATVKLFNAGSEELIIQNVKPSCGCTTAPLDKDVLKPGEEATLVISMKISKGGKQSKTIRISSNDPQNPQQTLRIVANVIEQLSIQPSKILRFKELEVGKESTASLSIFNKDSKPVKISDITVKPENLIVTFKNSSGKVTSGNALINPGEKVDIIATITPQKDGYFRADIKMKTDHPDYNELKVNGYGNVKSSPIFNNN